MTLYTCHLCDAPHREYPEEPMMVRILCCTCREWIEIEGLAAQLLSPRKPEPQKPYDDGYSA